MSRQNLRPAPLALAIALALGSAAVHAQGAASPDAPVQIAIKAQPLAEALNDWARQTRLQLIARQELLAGKTAPAVSGVLTPSQALDRLLTGSGLAATREGDAVVIQPARPAASTALPEVVVRSGAELNAATQGKGYSARAVTMFGNTQSLKDIPSSVSVLTRQQMEDQNVNTIISAMLYSPGVASISYFGNNSGSSGSTGYYNARGFPVTVSLDGFSALNGIQWRPQFDMAMYDRVEVFRGPSGLLNGQGAFGGTINLVRKRPTDAFQLQSETSVGSWASLRQMIDVSGPINQDGSLRGRIVGLAGRANSYIDGQYSRTSMAYGTLEYDIDAQTTVSLSAGQQKDPNHRPDYGVGYDSADNIVIGPRGWSQNFGPDWNYASNTTKEVSASLRHRFGDDWNAEATLVSRQVPMYSKYAFSNNPAAGTYMATYQGQEQDIKDDWLGMDARVSGTADVLGRNTEVLLGVNRSVYSEKYIGSNVSMGTYNIFSPDIPELDAPFTSGTKTKVTQSSLYGHVNAHLTEQFSLVLGGRYLFFKQRSQTLLPTLGDWSTKARENGKFVPYGGLVFALTPEVSAYASYSKAFSAQTNTTYSGEAIQPFTGEQYEAGLKSSALDGRLNASIAAFRIKGSDLAVADQLHPGFSIASGAMRSQGWEAEVSGSPVPEWNLSASYTRADTKYTASPTSQGQSYNGETPRHMVKLWNTYRFTQGALQRFMVGAGLYFQSNTWRLRPQYHQGSYALYSAKIGYRFNEHLEADLSVNNLFDKRYYSRAPYLLFAEYGAPRNAALTLRAKF
ncbi:TonB-dependent siderophore receptor [Pseudorhodoferax sp.]|uniref:TonB-dependent siderophore receptor n=1 Tax=Pseudorhodoferax sp. TaxID=1993553 RepID=UPI0039E6C279